MEDIPEELIQSDNKPKGKPKLTSPHKGGVMVMISPREGLCIQKNSLDYHGAKTIDNFTCRTGTKTYYCPIKQQSVFRYCEGKTELGTL